MNLTLSVNDEIANRAREVAREQGTSLNALVRQFIEGLAGRRSGNELVARLEEVWKEGGHSGGHRWRREDAYEDGLQ